MNKNDKNFMVQKIRSKYAEKEFTELDALRALDRKVKLPSNIFGIVGALLMGSGMSLIMTDIGASLAISPVLCVVIGLIFGVPGMAMIGIDYPVYNLVLRHEREKIAPEILALADEIEKE